MLHDGQENMLFLFEMDVSPVRTGGTDIIEYRGTTEPKAKVADEFPTVLEMKYLDFDNFLPRL